MTWQAPDALLAVLFATLYAGFYALLGGRGYRRLLLVWLASLAGAIVGYVAGQLCQLGVLWLGSFPWPEATLGSVVMILLASRLRI